MKAVQFVRFGGPDVLEYLNLPRPSPQANEVLIEVAASGVHHRDARERAGVYQRPDAKLDGVDLPRIPGAQVVGTVIELGHAVDPGLLGRRVMAYLPRGGGYAEYAATLSAFAVPLPGELNDREMAAILGQGAAAWLMLKVSTELRPGEGALVHGAAGGVGSMAVQIAKVLGAGLVVATAATQEKRDFALSLGADAAIDYEDPRWPQAVNDATGGRGVDIILESVGGDVFHRNFECLATQGRVILFSSIRPLDKPFEPRRLMAKSQTLTGFFGGLMFWDPALFREALDFLVDR
jgi:NADPH2:quinone reductase